MIYQLEEDRIIIGLYLAEDNIHSKIRIAYKNWQCSEFYEDLEFEEYCTTIENFKVERVFVEEIYV